MRADYLNPFYQATKEVFRLMLDLEPERNQLAAANKLVANHKANVLISVTGDLTGDVLFGFPEPMILEMVKIMSGMEVSSLDPFVLSALEEIANIISGNAVTHLSSKDYACDIAPPRLVGLEEKLVRPSGDVLVLSLTTPIGEFGIQLSIQE